MKRYWHWHNRLWVSLSSGWFGIRKNFADFLLLSVPLLQEYVNVSYYKNQHSLLPTTPTTEDDKGKKQEEQTNTDLFPYEDIYAPEWQVGVVLIYFYSSFSFFFLIIIIIIIECGMESVFILQPLLHWHEQ